MRWALLTWLLLALPGHAAEGRWSTGDGLAEVENEAGALLTLGCLGPDIPVLTLFYGATPIASPARLLPVQAQIRYSNGTRPFDLGLFQRGQRSLTGPIPSNFLTALKRGRGVAIGSPALPIGYEFPLTGSSRSINALGCG